MTGNVACVFKNILTINPLTGGKRVLAPQYWRRWTSSTHNRPRLLFACVANSCRSQLAEALGHKHLGDLYDIHSAGSTPSKPNEWAVEFLKSKGHDTSKLFSKSYADIPKPVDLAISMCDEGDMECGSYFDSSILSRKCWSQKDPAKMESKEEAMKQLEIVYGNIEGLMLDLRRETLEQLSDDINSGESTSNSSN